MSQLKIFVNKKTTSIDDMIEVEELMEKKRIKPIKNVLARYIIGEDGHPMPREMAEKLVGALNLDEFNELVVRFAENLKSQPLPMTGDGQ